LYKRISKILENRIKCVLLKLIDNNESTFLRGYGLLDSILIANKMVDDFKEREEDMGDN